MSENLDPVWLATALSVERNRVKALEAALRDERARLRDALEALKVEAGEAYRIWLDGQLSNVTAREEGREMPFGDCLWKPKEVGHG